ncbi:MAG: M3 family metallopeptidase [Reichenbachiella sp.]|uniref:M3 family metallopeptidase n=1 Tax=Reichenbachiella sp. TaxID=2184521 RepID=UPI003264A12B
MKFFLPLLLAVAIYSCQPADEKPETNTNPFVGSLNEPVDYANATADDLEKYALSTLEEAADDMEKIAKVVSPTFDNVFAAMDDINNQLTKASNNCFMLYWVSPDSLTRVKGLAGYKKVDSLFTMIYSNKALYDQMVSFSQSEKYESLEQKKKNLVDDLIDSFKRSGVNLNAEDLATYKRLNKDINDLTARYSNNMNSSSEILTLDEAGAKGLPKNFKNTYATSEGVYEVPIINATRGPVMKNASSESTRRAYYMKFNNRAADKNLDILDTLVQKRYELAQLMGYDTYAAYNLTPKMAKNPETVWDFINNLVDATKEKAKMDLELLAAQNLKDTNQTNPGLDVWDISYYRNELLKTEYNVDSEKIRGYLSMDKCLAGMFALYQDLLDLEFRKVENGSVWHEEVEMYEVFENDKLKGRFYLDLYPRPNKESWFYGVPIADGKQKENGYEVPVSMLLGNFTRPTESLPSLLSHGELSTLFHEFGHIVDGMSYEGEFALQADSKSDFAEAMSQIFENWIWDYETLSSFATHYETGEVLPKELFDNMVRAKNISSGLYAIGSLRRCIYDLNLYDLYDPANKIPTDDIWRKIDKEMGLMDSFVEGTHPQSSWIHINTHPVYMYGYLWSDVYAQDMFSVFEKNGMRDQETGKRYRKLILANGTQRDVVEAVEEFLGRPSDNSAYMKSLGLGD